MLSVKCLAKIIFFRLKRKYCVIFSAKCVNSCFIFLLLFCLGKVKMSNYRTSDEVASLLFEDNQEDLSTSNRLDDDDDCSNYVPSDDDNKEDIILFDPDYDSEDNNYNAEAGDASGRYIINTTTVLFTSKSGVESWAAELLLPLTSKASQRNIIREKSGLIRYVIRMSGSLGDCFTLFFRDNLLEEICKCTTEEGQVVFSNNWIDTTVAELIKVIGTLLLVGVYKSSNEDLSQLWHMDIGDQLFVKLSRVIAFKIYYVFFDSMTLQLDDLPD